MPLHPTLELALQHRVFPITKRIAQGQFTTPTRATVLRDQQITHVLNVSDAPSIIKASEFGFEQVVDVPVTDLQTLSASTAIRAIDALHAMLSEPDSKAYIHCIAGHNRSPTILWLYFVACGLSPGDAQTLIEIRSPDAVAGHSLLINDNLVTRIQAHGKSHCTPLPDAAILDPAY